MVYENGVHNKIIVTSLGNDLIVNNNGSIDTNKLDRTNLIVDFLFTRVINSVTVAGAVVRDSNIINLGSGHGIVNGDILELSESGRFYQGGVTNVSVNAITVGAPFDFAFTTNASGNRSTKDMKVDGSSTSQIYSIRPPVSLFNSENTIWNMSRMILTINHSGAGDDSKFGSISSLTNGLLFRVKNTNWENIFCAIDNGDFALRSYDVTYSDKAGGGNFSTRVRRTFNGSDKNGVAIELIGITADELEIVVQDDLSVAGIISIYAVAQGRYV